ncbi:MAG: hypothetical protein ACOYLG_01110 [Chitinophagaceae bacterium]
MNNYKEVKLLKRFISSHSRRAPASDLYKSYLFYYNKYSNNYDTDGLGVGSCLGYLKRLLLEFEPEVIFKEAKTYETDAEKFNNSEECYLLLMNRVALIELFYKDYQSTVHWAKKAIEAFNYFHPDMNEESKRNLMLANPNYSDCLNLYVEYFDYYEPEVHALLKFKWEDS